MNRPNRNTQSQDLDNDNNVDDFYESMPATMDHYTYRDDATAVPEPSDSNPARAEADAKFTAVTTLILVALVAVLMGILLFRGLDMIKNSTTPANLSDTTASLDL